MVDGTYQYNVKKIQQAHAWNQDRAKKAMAKGVSPVVIDNTNLSAWEPKAYVEYGLSLGGSRSDAQAIQSKSTSRARRGPRTLRSWPSETDTGCRWRPLPTCWAATRGSARLTTATPSKTSLQTQGHHRGRAAARRALYCLVGSRSVNATEFSSPRLRHTSRIRLQATQPVRPRVVLVVATQSRFSLSSFGHFGPPQTCRWRLKFRTTSL